MPNPRYFLDVLYDPEVVGTYEAQLKRFTATVLELLPSKISYNGTDITANIREAYSKWKWVQLNLCKYLQVEEVRLQGLYGNH